MSFESEQERERREEREKEKETWRSLGLKEETWGSGGGGWISDGHWDWELVSGLMVEA